MYNTVIIRYGEIFLKSEFIRGEFEKKLIRNIKKRIGDASIFRKRHRIYIKTENAKEVSERLKTVFGIVSVSPAIKTDANVEDITEISLALAKKIIRPGERFAVRAERSGRHDFSSKDIENLVGEEILNSIHGRVDLENPDKTIFIEVRDDLAFIFDKKIKGLGGLPYKSQGRLIALLSTGIDSPVAAWMMMRRGCEIVVLHLGNVNEIKEIMNRLEFFTDEKIKSYIIPYDKILEKISEHSGRYTCIVCKRFMYRIAERVAEIENAHGIVTGENIGQVASQTLENLKVINCLDIPVYMPLVGMDKEDIIKIAKDIGTYGLVKGKKCDYIPKKPVTRSSEEIITKIEEEMGIERFVENVQDNFILKKGPSK